MAAPPPPPGPLDDNPFVKKGQVAAAPSVFHEPAWEREKEFKMNDHWTLYLWRDTANGVSCYMYGIDDKDYGMSCVKN